MTDPLYPLLLLAVGFALGFAAGQFLPTLWAARLRRAILRRTPRRCPVCGAWCWTGDMEHALHKLAGWTRVCHHCYAKQYHPFSGSDQE